MNDVKSVVRYRTFTTGVF